MPPSQCGFSPILTCPICGYDQRGLPEGHVCPECAFACEREGRVFYGGSQCPTWLRWVMLIGWLVMMTMAWDSLRARKWRTLGFLGFGIWTIVSLFRSLRRPAPRAIVFSRGLIVFADNGSRREIPWREVGSVKYSQMIGLVFVFDHSGGTLARLGHEEFGGWNKAKELAVLIEEQIGKSQPQGGDPGAPGQPAA